MMIAFKILAACSLDVGLGDPRWLPHPVRLMGRFIQWYERVTHGRCHDHRSQYAGGMVLALGLPTLAFWATSGVIGLAGQLHVLLGDLVWVYLGYTTLAARDLWDHAMRVHLALKTGRLNDARTAVSWIVGRDTTHLSEPEVIRATIETVAENTSDGIVAPLFYLTVGGPPCAMAYKAVNTLDSMIGHPSQQYRYIGWASARLDDFVNWIPARLTGLLVVLAAAIRLGSGQEAWRIVRRDARKHVSPNSGWPEAAMAGGLQIQLGGINHYQGLRSERPLLGENRQPLKPGQILLALQCMGLASILAVSLLVATVSWW